MSIENDSGRDCGLNRRRMKLAYNAKGLILESEGKYASSNAAYENASRIDPLWASPRINNMHSLQALGKMDEAMKIFVAV